MKKPKLGIKNYHNNSESIEKISQKKIDKSMVREVKFTIISVFIVAITMIATSYAVFTSINKADNFNTITVGTLQIVFTDKEEGLGNTIKLNGAYPESDEDGLRETPYTFKISNTGNIDANYSIKIVDDQEMINEDHCSDKLLDKSKIKVSVNDETPFILSTKESNGYIIKEGILKPNASKVTDIKLWITEEAGNEILNKHFHGKIVVESSNLSANNSISSAYIYNDSTCKTGEEETCEETTCYKDKTAGACPTGTIIKYRVNDSEEKSFHVINDDGENLTLQQIDNTVYGTNWNYNSTISEGPIAALNAIEATTSSWTNVNNQSYDNYTDCTITDTTALCGNNLYKLGDRSAKARLITAQEINDMNCISSECKEWMKGSYWTMSTANNQAVYIDENSTLKTAVPTTSLNLKALIEINK